MCPECNREADMYYCRDGEVVGCEYCVETAWSDELFPEDTAENRNDVLLHEMIDSGQRLM